MPAKKKPEPKKKAAARKPAPKKKAPAKKAAPVDVTKDMEDMAKRGAAKARAQGKESMAEIDKNLELTEGDAQGPETVPAVGEQPVGDPQEGDDDYADLRALIAKDVQGADADDLEFDEEDFAGVAVVRVKGAGRQDLIVFADYEDAERAALARVTQDLEDNPELFNQDWLRGYYTMSDTDIRITAGEEADAYIDNMSDRDIVEAARLEDEYEAAEAWDLATDEEKAELEDPGKTAEAILEEARELERDRRYEEVSNMLESDPVSYFADELGLGDEEAYAIMAKAGHLDIDEAAQNAVDTDGVGHFLSSWDGDLHELSDGRPYILE